MSKLRVLFVTSEVYPLVKTGGLADVSYSLPKDLRELGVDARLLLPGYPSVLDQLSLTCIYEKLSLFSTLEPVRLLKGVLPEGDIPIYVVDCPKLYARPGDLYQDDAGNDWADNALRFGALSKSAAVFGNQQLSFQPQIIHCNDWQTGLTPAFLAYSQPPSPTRTIMGVHNLAYQGVFEPKTMDLLNLPKAAFGINGVEFYGKMSFLKAGLFYANWVTTVSPTYAQEIQTNQFGCGLAALLTQRQHQLAGILNGIDVEAWNPSTDTHIDYHYTSANLINKSYNKQALRERLNLAPLEDTALIGMITRLTQQKGIDLLVPVLHDIIREGAQLVLLGSGDKTLKNSLLELARAFPDKVSINIGYDENLAHQIIAGADMFLMPSRFEPCGLTQMYAMRYGTVPIVRNTGGLADTVTDTTPAHINDQTATGFLFTEEEPEKLLRCVQRALLVFRDRATWQKLQFNGMSTDFSWHKRAQQYVNLYHNILALKS
ncbi:MAG: starch synthase [Beggiatoa sp. IS2]|nr:MAG: starch synthase [Beggiatoa sp. IS2]